MGTFKSYLSAEDVLKLDKQRTMNGGKKEHFDSHYNTLVDLDKNGGEVYRLVFVDSPSKINRKKLGRHWVIDKRYFDGPLYFNIANSHEEGAASFLIAAKIPPNNIDVKASMEEFAQLPDEGEVQLKSNPVDIAIEKYAHTRA